MQKETPVAGWWWYILLIPALGRQRQADDLYEFEANLVYKN